MGRLGGVIYVEADNAFRETSGGTEGTYSASGGIYRSLAFGDESFGTVELAVQSPSKPQLFINDKPDKSDPMNQKMQVGWKSMFVGKVLNTAWFTTISSKTTFVAA